MSLNHYEYMSQAIDLAKQAADAGEVPVGAIVVRNSDGKILGRGGNRTEMRFDPTAHAEIIAIRAACAENHNWRLEDCTIYVTLEPCAMCAATICHSRISSIVFGAPDSKMGACGSVLNMPAEKGIDSSPQVLGGIMEEECGALLSEFFRNKRH